MRRAAALSFAALPLAALLLLLVASACDGGNDRSTAPTAAAPSPSPAAAVASPTPIAEPASEQAIPVPPPRDPVDLARRLQGLEGEVPTQVNASAPDYAVGDRQDFIVLRLAPFGASETPPTTETISAVLRLVTPHAYFYVEDGMSVYDSELEQAGRDFEEEVYPQITEDFGHERSPGIDADPHVTILLARLLNIGGYFSPDDEYPKIVAPLSNQREMVYVGAQGGLAGSRGHTALVAHEFQHLVHFNADEDEDTWVNEGMSEVAGGLISGGANYGDSFLRQPDTQLNTWSSDADVTLHYGASDLFFRYLAERLGGPEALGRLAATPEDGIEGIRAFLEREDTGLSFEELFADWLVANYLGGYDELTTTAAPSALLVDPREESTDVHQFGADYIGVGLVGGDAVLDFDGDTEVPVLPNEPHSGSGQWWANRGDAIDTTLTREFDLSGLSTATLSFWTWYDIEGWYDYAYVEASTDGGQTWTALPGQHTTDEDPVARAYGPGYTGKSGGGSEPVWVEEKVDLTPFVGDTVLLRFEYVTDAGYNAPGWAIDDIAIPELGFADDAESDGGWESDGFARLHAPLPQRFILNLIEVGAETKVTDVPLDEDNHAEIELRGFGDGLDKAVLVVAGATEGTTEPAGYSYSLRTLP
jgi:immune inhibitor A